MPTINRAAALAWCGALISPLVLVLAVTNPATDPVLRIALVLLAVGLPTGLLPRRPLPVLSVFLLLLSTVTLTGDNVFHQRTIQALLAIAVCVSVGFLAALRSRWVSLSGAMATLLIGVAITAFENPGALVSVVVAEVLAVVTAWLIGNSVRQRARFAAAQRQQAEARALQTERLRIARDLHDMIAHSIGVIAIQAGVGRRVIDTQPDEARDSLAAIEDVSRDTLAALRRMLGTLRRSDPEPGSAPLDPAPGLADLDGLITRTRDAGVHVDFVWVGSRPQLPPDIDLSAFRIIQEAVTNVIRHADTPRCQVTVHHRPDELSIEVTDDGRHKAAAVERGGSRSADTGRSGPAGTETGRGGVASPDTERGGLASTHTERGWHGIHTPPSSDNEEEAGTDTRSASMDTKPADTDTRSADTDTKAASTVDTTPDITICTAPDTIVRAGHGEPSDGRTAGRVRSRRGASSTAWPEAGDTIWAEGSYQPGHGITGMRERISLLDGEFDAAARPDGGFRVSARIPLPDDSRAGTDRA
jgi:signal transduction histidine kinase